MIIQADCPGRRGVTDGQTYQRMIGWPEIRETDRVRLGRATYKPGTYEQLHIASEALGDSVNYLVPEALIKVEFYGSEPVGIELPQTVDLKVEDTAPGIKGATASAQVKPATLETGLVVQVPPFVNTGDVIRVNTETGEYLSRA